MAKACKFVKKETPTQLISFKYCKRFKNTYFEEHLGTAVSVIQNTEEKKFLKNEKMANRKLEKVGNLGKIIPSF